MEADTGACTVLRRDGSPCRAPAQPGKIVCVFHDAERQAAMTEARRAGGRAKAAPARLAKLVPTALRPVLAQLLEAVREVHDGTLTPGQASGMAAVASAASRLYQVAELEGRLQALEEMLAEPGKVAARR